MKNADLESIKKKMNEAGFDSLIVSNRSNIRYVTGFDCDYGFVIISKSGSFILLTSSIYEEDARAVLQKPFQVKRIKKSVYKSLAQFDRKFWGKTTGYNPNGMTCSFFQKLKKTVPSVSLKPATGFFDTLREIKKPSELQSITKAQRINETVFYEILNLVTADVTELDLACEIDYRFRKNGGERAAFETIVASGPNSSKPHAVPTGRKIKTGDIILFDMGTVAEGYASDMTRTVVLGKADSEQKKIYNLVLDAQTAAIDSISAGTKCSKVYRKALGVFKKAGYGKQFIHSLGHGVGLDVHEHPRLSPDNKESLKQHSVITVEPGLYVPGWGGVRIEDMVLVEEDGCRNLTGAPKLLLEL